MCYFVLCSFVSYSYHLNREGYQAAFPSVLYPDFQRRNVRFKDGEVESILPINGLQRAYLCNHIKQEMVMYYLRVDIEATWTAVDELIKGKAV